MARKTQMVVISEENRDKGKTFQITEMSADAAEMWGYKIISTLARSGVQVEEFGQVNWFDNDWWKSQSCMALLAVISIKAFGLMQFEDARPILDELFTCLKIIPDPSKPQVIRNIAYGDIEEVSTSMMLRATIFDMHFSVFVAAVRSTFSMWASRTSAA